MFALLISIAVMHGILAFVCGHIATKKGYSYEGFVILGLILGLVALVVSILMPDKNGSTSSESDKATALRKYRDLLDDGTITQEEFDAKKRELLS
jgi:uncharacterized membrane protein